MIYDLKDIALFVFKIIGFFVLFLFILLVISSGSEYIFNLKYKGLVSAFENNQSKIVTAESGPFIKNALSSCIANKSKAQSAKNEIFLYSTNYETQTERQFNYLFRPFHSANNAFNVLRKNCLSSIENHYMIPSIYGLPKYTVNYRKSLYEKYGFSKEYEAQFDNKDFIPVVNSR